MLGFGMPAGVTAAPAHAAMKALRFIPHALHAIGSDRRLG